MYFNYLNKSHWIKTHAELFSASLETSSIRTSKVICQTNLNRTFHFADPKKINELLEGLEKNLTLKASKVKNMVDIAELIATFWFFMIAIHPFSNGNRRTTQKIINQILTHFGLEEMNFALINSFLFHSYEDDFPKLSQIFLYELRKLS